jgi:ABC-type uncharacterized transport system substrate-binding protein
MSEHTNRRSFLTLLGTSAAAWPLAAKAQKRPAMPVVGFLHLFSAEGGATTLAAFRAGLGDSGYVEGRNIAMEVRWADNQPDRLPALAADLVRRRVAAIVTASLPAARAAKAATTTIPLVFALGEDPVKEGLVPSLNLPNGNLTGVTTFSNQLLGKRFGILHDIVPKSAPFALLVNSDNENAESDTKDAQAAADALGRRLRVMTARTESELDAAFAVLAQQRIGGLQVNVDGFFIARRVQIAALAARYSIPAMYDRREFAAAGGLMSYGADRALTTRQTGIYIGRILKGEKPADLPVQQPTKFEFIINLRTAKALGLDIPPGVLAIVDEVVE